MSLPRPLPAEGCATIWGTGAAVCQSRNCVVCFLRTSWACAFLSWPLPLRSLPSLPPAVLLAACSKMPPLPPAMLQAPCDVDHCDHAELPPSLPTPPHGAVDEAAAWCPWWTVVLAAAAQGSSPAAQGSAGLANNWAAFFSEDGAGSPGGNARFCPGDCAALCSSDNAKNCPGDVATYCCGEAATAYCCSDIAIEYCCDGVTACCPCHCAALCNPGDW
mmetsp:Transcript_16847/g.46066  ORF Transcript_16847/g.46066 Transcript_16847/m.46066 type:complete len:218 (-) Transcript_16847:383-1036(-)